MLYRYVLILNHFAKVAMYTVMSYACAHVQTAVNDIICPQISLYTVQEEILAREIFGEIARLKHLANFTLTNDIWMY